MISEVFFFIAFLNRQDITLTVIWFSVTCLSPGRPPFSLYGFFFNSLFNFLLFESLSSESTVKQT